MTVFIYIENNVVEYHFITTVINSHECASKHPCFTRTASYPVSKAHRFLLSHVEFESGQSPFSSENYSTSPENYLSHQRAEVLAS